MRFLGDSARRFLSGLLSRAVRQGVLVVDERGEYQVADPVVYSLMLGDE